jgi:hypothetical protein
MNRKSFFEELEIKWLFDLRYLNKWDRWPAEIIKFKILLKLLNFSFLLFVLQFFADKTCSSFIL